MFTAHIENRGDSRAFATTRHGAFLIDTEGGGSNPIDTLLASLAGCIGHQLCDYFRADKIENKGFGIKAEGQLMEDGSRLSEISLEIDLRALSNWRTDKVLAYVEGCKIRRTLGDRIKLDVSVIG